MKKLSISKDTITKFSISYFIAIPFIIGDALSISSPIQFIINYKIEFGKNTLKAFQSKGKKVIKIFCFSKVNFDLGMMKSSRF